MTCRAMLRLFDYASAAIDHAIPIFEVLHRLAGSLEADLRNPTPGARPLASDGTTLPDSEPDSEREE